MHTLVLPESSATFQMLSGLRQIFKVGGAPLCHLLDCLNIVSLEVSIGCLNMPVMLRRSNHSHVHKKRYLLSFHFCKMFEITEFIQNIEHLNNTTTFYTICRNCKQTQPQSFKKNIAFHPIPIHLS